MPTDAIDYYLEVQQKHQDRQYNLKKFMLEKAVDAKKTLQEQDFETRKAETAHGWDEEKAENLRNALKEMEQIKTDNDLKKKKADMYLGQIQEDPAAALTLVEGELSDMVAEQKKTFEDKGALPAEQRRRLNELEPKIAELRQYSAGIKKVLESKANADLPKARLKAMQANTMVLHPDGATTMLSEHSKENPVPEGSTYLSQTKDGTTQVLRNSGNTATLSPKDRLDAIMKMTETLGISLDAAAQMVDSVSQQEKPLQKQTQPTTSPGQFLPTTDPFQQPPSASRSLTDAASEPSREQSAQTKPRQRSKIELNLIMKAPIESRREVTQLLDTANQIVAMDKQKGLTPESIPAEHAQALQAIRLRIKELTGTDVVEQGK